LKQLARKKEKESEVYNNAVDMYMLKYRYIPSTTTLDYANDFYNAPDKEDSYAE
jgi:hypothetical protein